MKQGSSYSRSRRDNPEGEWNKKTIKETQNKRKDKYSNVWEQPYFKINIKKIKNYPFPATNNRFRKYKILFDRI